MSIVVFSWTVGSLAPSFPGTDWLPSNCLTALLGHIDHPPVTNKPPTLPSPPRPHLQLRAEPLHRSHLISPTPRFYSPKFSINCGSSFPVPLDLLSPQSHFFEALLNCVPESISAGRTALSTTTTAAPSSIRLSPHLSPFAIDCEVDGEKIGKRDTAIGGKEQPQ